MKIHTYGNDQRIVRAARVSYGKDQKLNKNDAVLLAYLVKERHASPFEHCWFIVEDKNFEKEIKKIVETTNNPSLINTFYSVYNIENKRLTFFTLRNMINLFFMTDKVEKKDFSKLCESFIESFPGVYNICNLYKTFGEEAYDLIKENPWLEISKEKNTKPLNEIKLDNNLGYIALIDKKEFYSPMDLYTFVVECPIFVARQWFRHRFGSYNEISRRYTKENISIYLPKKLRKQSKVNKQASLEEIIEKNEIYVQKMEELFDKSLKLYEELIKEDVAKEIARIVLPLSLKTRFYWTVPLVSLDNFIKLRDSEHAQKEIKLYAEAIKEIINYKEKEEIIKDLFRRSYF